MSRSLYLETQIPYELYLIGKLSQPSITELVAFEDSDLIGAEGRYMPSQPLNSFVMEVDGLLMNYLLHCPDTDIYVEGRVNLTLIFDPETG